MIGLAGVVALGVCLVGSGVSFAEDAAKKEAPAKKEAAVSNKNKRNGGPMGPIYSVWAKELGLDEATQTKLAEISTQQEEAAKPIAAKIAEVTKALEEDKAAGKADDAKAKQAEIMKLKAEQAKVGADYRAKAMALLSAEQQKKVIAITAFKSSNFKKVTLTPEQQKKVMEKLEASADSISNEQKDVDGKKAAPVLKALEEEVLTAEQKAELVKAREEMKARMGGGKKTEAAAPATPAK